MIVHSCTHSLNCFANNLQFVCWRKLAKGGNTICTYSVGLLMDTRSGREMFESILNKFTAQYCWVLLSPQLACGEEYTFVCVALLHCWNLLQSGSMSAIACSCQGRTHKATRKLALSQTDNSPESWDGLRLQFWWQQKSVKHISPVHSCHSQPQTACRTTVFSMPSQHREDSHFQWCLAEGTF